MPRDFRLQVFPWISFPRAPESTIRTDSHFFENSRRYSQQCCWHQWQMEKIFNQKSFTYFLGHLLVVELTYKYIVFFKFTLRCQQSDIVPIICHQWQQQKRKFAAGVIDTAGNLPLVLLTPMANLSPILLTPVANLPTVLVTKFSASVVDTGGAPWLANISAELLKNLKWP